MVIIKYQWLLEHKELEEEINILEWKIKRSELELSRWVEGDLMDVKLDRDSLSSSLEKNIERDKKLLAEKEKAMESLMIMIDRFKGVENEIIKLKYIEGYSLKEIAEEMDYSYSYIMAKHAQLVRVIKFVECL